MDDVLILQSLIELSNILSPENPCNIADVKFPLLDKDTVELAMKSAVYVLENKPKWGTFCTKLIKKWCDVRSVTCRHLSWMETRNSLTSTDCLLAVCRTLTDLNSPKNLLSLEPQQQEAICYAILSLAGKMDKAKKKSIKLIEFIFDHPELVDIHSDFLAEVWKLRGMLGLSFKQLELIVLKSPCGLEKELLGIATSSINSNLSEINFFGEEDETSLVTLCKSSPVIFQVATSILMRLVQTSQAHQSVLNILTDLVERCTMEEQNIVRLFPVKCQVALALLSISPEETDIDSFVVHLLDTLSDLPSITSTLLVILYPCWLPYLVDKL